MRKALGSNPSVSICFPFPHHASGTKATAEAGHNITDAKKQRVQLTRQSDI